MTRDDARYMVNAALDRMAALRAEEQDARPSSVQSQGKDCEKSITFDKGRPSGGPSHSGA